MRTPLPGFSSRASRLYSAFARSPRRPQRCEQVCKRCKKLYLASIPKSRKTASAATRTATKILITLRLDADRFKRLEILANAENRTVTNFVETAVLRDLETKEEAARVIAMIVPSEGAALAPGPLLRTEGESDERYAERSALMDRLFDIPHSA